MRKDGSECPRNSPKSFLASLAQFTLPQAPVLSVATKPKGQCSNVKTLVSRAAPGPGGCARLRLMTVRSRRSWRTEAHPPEPGVPESPFCNKIPPPGFLPSASSLSEYFAQRSASPKAGTGAGAVRPSWLSAGAEFSSLTLPSHPSLLSPGVLVLFSPRWT